MSTPFPPCDLADALVDPRQAGLIYLDHEGAILESNARAREVLRQDGGLQELDGRLTARRQADVEALESILESAFGGRAGPRAGGCTVVGAWPNERPLTVHVNQANSGATGVAAVVVLLDPWRRVRLRPEQVAMSLGLTPAESRVAVALAEGMTIREIAQATNRKTRSVRWLVQQALSKTWSSRQADLVRLVLLSSHLFVAQESASPYRHGS